MWRCPKLSKVQSTYWAVPWRWQHLFSPSVYSMHCSVALAPPTFAECKPCCMSWRCVGDMEVKCENCTSRSYSRTPIFRPVYDAAGTAVCNHIVFPDRHLNNSEINHPPDNGSPGPGLLLLQLNLVTVRSWQCWQWNSRGDCTFTNIATECNMQYDQTEDLITFFVCPLTRWEKYALCRLPPVSPSW